MTDTKNTIPDETPAQPDAEAALAAARAELAALKSSLAEAQRRRALDRALAEAGAIDVEAAAIVALASPGADGADPAALAAGLKRARPFLFHPARPGPSAAPIAPAEAPLDRAAADARATGDRRSVLAYLRLKRAQSP